jgi:Helicase conserved C-terminal domain
MAIHNRHDFHAFSALSGSDLCAAAFRRGVAIHHGRVPRAVGQKLIREFNLSHIRYMICTSTLIEGVNSAAKNVIIFDKQINRRNYDFFTYSNIQGRAGRMFQHFIGKVFRYHEPPREEIVDIESPILKDPEEAPDELLIIVEDDDLTARMKRRIEDIAAVSRVSLDLLRRYATLGPEFVNGAAEILAEILQTTEGRPLLWRGSPDYRQLEQTCRFIWLNLKHEDYGATSWRALTYWINDLRRLQNVTAFLQARLDSRQTRSVDAVIDNVFKFLRACEFNLPRLFALIQDIINELSARLELARLELEPVNYLYIIGGLENWFMSDGVKILEEYGIPIQISQKLWHR